MDKGLELAKLARRDRQEFDLATWLHKARQMPKEQSKQVIEKELTGGGKRSPGKSFISNCTRAKSRSSSKRSRPQLSCSGPNNPVAIVWR